MRFGVTLLIGVALVGCGSKLHEDAGNTSVDPGSPEVSDSTNECVASDEDQASGCVVGDFEYFSVSLEVATRSVDKAGIFRAVDSEGTVEGHVTQSELAALLPIIASKAMRDALASQSCPTGFDGSATIELRLASGTLTDPFAFGCGNDSEHAYVKALYAMVALQKSYYQCPNVDAEYDGSVRGICHSCYSWPGGCVD